MAGELSARKRLLAPTMTTVITANFWMVGWGSAPPSSRYRLNAE